MFCSLDFLLFILVLFYGSIMTENTLFHACDIIVLRSPRPCPVELVLMSSFNNSKGKSSMGSREEKHFL